MDTNYTSLVAGVAASVGVMAHGVVGQRWLSAQLEAAEMPVTSLSRSLFGPGDAAAQIFGVTWHSVTAVFAASAVALYLTAFGALSSRDLLRYIAVVHLAFLAIGAFYIGRRPGTLVRGVIPPLFVGVMLTGVVCSWVASNSV